MENNLIRLKTELNQISKRIFALKNQIERESDIQKVRQLDTELKQLQRRALYCIKKLK